VIEKIWWQAVTKRKKSPFDMLLFLFLFLLSLFYGAGLAVRNVIYRMRQDKKIQFGARVISIGNITMGGTGKTPFTEELAKRIMREGKKVLVAAKGYKRKPVNPVDIVHDGEAMLMKQINAGDEPFMMARNLKTARVVVGSDKLKALAAGINMFKPDIALLDDGFQKRYMIKNVMNVVLIDALNPFGFGRLTPAGLLREPVSSLKDADAVVITNTNLVENQEKTEMIRAEIEKKGRNSRIFEAELQPRFFYNVFTGDRTDIGQMRGKKAVVFSAIGNPVGFERALKMIGVHVVVGLRFRDHHKVTAREAAAMCKLMEKTSATVIITTEKDEVKITRKFFQGSNKVYALKTGMLIKNVKELEKRLRL